MFRFDRVGGDLLYTYAAYFMLLTPGHLFCFDLSFLLFLDCSNVRVNIHTHTHTHCIEILRSDVNGVVATTPLAVCAGFVHFSSDAEWFIFIARVYIFFLALCAYVVASTFN